MKKITSLLLTLVMILSVTVFLPSCGEDAKTVYEKAEKAMSALKSYSMKYDIETSVTTMGITMKVPVKSDAYVDHENKKVLCTTTTEVAGVSSEAKVYLDSEVYMMETMGMKYMGKVEGKLSELMNSYGSAMGMSFDSFKETTMEKENGGYALTVKGLKEGTDIRSLLGSAGDMLGEDDQKTLDAIKGFDTVELTLHIDKDYRYTSVDLSMTLTVDASKLDAQVKPAADGGIMPLSAEDGGDDLDLGSGDLDFDLGSGDADIDLGEMTVTLSGSSSFGDFDAAADKVVKPSTDGYEEADLDEILGMSGMG